MGQHGPKHVEVIGYCNIAVNRIQLYAFIGLNYSNKACETQHNPAVLSNVLAALLTCIAESELLASDQHLRSY
jgi:hypothetical protein